jgi:hypothetical protein
VDRTLAGKLLKYTMMVQENLDLQNMFIMSHKFQVFFLLFMPFLFGLSSSKRPSSQIG